MGDKFCNHYVNHTEEGHTGFSMDMARKRLQLGESLYYKVLEKIINDEKRRLKSETDLSGIYLIIWLDDLIFESNNYFARSDYFWLPSSFPIWVEYFWANFVCYHEYSTSNYLSFSKFFSCLLLLVFDFKKCPLSLYCGCCLCYLIVIIIFQWQSCSSLLWCFLLRYSPTRHASSAINYLLPRDCPFLVQFSKSFPLDSGGLSYSALLLLQGNIQIKY